MLRTYSRLLYATAVILALTAGITFAGIGRASAGTQVFLGIVPGLTMACAAGLATFCALALGRLTTRMQATAEAAARATGRKSPDSFSTGEELDLISQAIDNLYGRIKVQEREALELLRRLAEAESRIEAAPGAEMEPLRGIVRSMTGMAICLLDSNDRIDCVNDEFARLAGHSTAEAEESILSPSVPAVGIVRAVGRLHNNNGSKLGTIVILVDVSELDEARCRAEASSRLKSEFLANMSHEIRTPMNGLLGLVELLEKSGLAGEQKRYLSLIRSQAEDLLVILGDILDLSRIEAGRLEIVKEPVELAALVADMRSFIEPIASRKSITFVTTVSPLLPLTVEADGVRIRQVLINLLSNALKFTSRGYIKLSITLYGRTGDIFHILFEVADTGIGIAPEVRDRIFESFAQAGSSVSRVYGGTGLGLAISSSLVRLMGGESIALTSVEGEGSRFSFLLPLRAVTSGPRKAEEASESESCCYERLRILVVEDNQLNQFLLKRILAGFGVASVVFVDDGRQALDRVEAEPDSFDVILMDIQMPVLDGLSASRKLRERGMTIPIVALTAYAMDTDRTKCIEAGMNHYLSKPYKVDQLRRIFNEIIKAGGKVA